MHIGLVAQLHFAVRGHRQEMVSLVSSCSAVFVSLLRCVCLCVRAWFMKRRVLRSVCWANGNGVLVDVERQRALLHWYQEVFEAVTHGDRGD